MNVIIMDLIIEIIFIISVITTTIIIVSISIIDMASIIFIIY